jgi:hypothetical protein
MAAQPDIQLQALNAGLQQLEGLQATRQQLGLFGNTPAIAGGQPEDKLAAIANLNTNVNDRLTGIKNRLTGG